MPLRSSRVWGPAWSAVPEPRDGGPAGPAGGAPAPAEPVGFLDAVFSPGADAGERRPGVGGSLVPLTWLRSLAAALRKAAGFDRG